ncbi:hypothetical protein LTR62_000466 [Meristemomyces frigidus]|uniref:tRNA (guanine(10)-N(2))-methyltransferase n=1 Tax=Meristemomyces frigidus TaxID=1508187 RepID=A0AAN7TU34_9PEZI|nr:hypothetical protein LTR62_000466 [Meristemomyces frigidus]
MNFQYLIRLVQMHETFRKPELDALANLAGVQIEWLSYSLDSAFAIIRFAPGIDTTAAARTLISRSLLCNAIYELWGAGTDYDELHQDVRKRTEHLWDSYRDVSFRFELDSFHSSRTTEQQREIIETFAYMGFEGPIVMKDPEHQFRVFEDSVWQGSKPHHLYLGRLVATGGRKAMNTYNLKKRKYIATTSMDAELSLITANLAQAAPGKIAYDPFTGTGSFPLACAHFGALVFGSDLDGRSIRGKADKSVASNFEQYGTSALYLGGLVADITNTPLRENALVDCIVCDPPYGVREGLKVLGSNKTSLKEIVLLADGQPAHLQSNYVPPKKPYSFLRMLDDILDFSAARLVTGGRLCMWMPVAGAVDLEEHTEHEALRDAEYEIPRHPALELVAVCTQDFSKWSRRLLTYRRLEERGVDEGTLLEYKAQRLQLIGMGKEEGRKADDLNAFRRKVSGEARVGQRITLLTRFGSTLRGSRTVRRDGSIGLGLVDGWGRASDAEEHFCLVYLLKWVGTAVALGIRSSHARVRTANHTTYPRHLDPLSSPQCLDNARSSELTHEHYAWMK